MAKLPKTFKKYEDNRKRTERFLNKVHRKSVSDWKKASRQREAARNKRLREYKREKEKQERVSSFCYLLVHLFISFVIVSFFMQFFTSFTCVPRMSGSASKP